MEKKTRSERAAEIKAIVAAEPGIRQIDLAERCGVSRATVCLTVQALMDAEQVEKVRDPGGKEIGLRLSPTSRRQALLRARWR